MSKRKFVDVTKDVAFNTSDIDSESLPLIRCICGKHFKPWDFSISIYDEDPYACPYCGTKLFFRTEIKVYRVEEK